MSPQAELTHPRYVGGQNHVFYESEGSTLAAHLFLPGGFDAGTTHPAIVLVRPATGVKEQTAGLYAERLAAKGFVTLAFDPRGFGESAGRKQLEDPLRVVQDIYNSITFLERLPFVSRHNIFSAGVCMGAGYAAYEAARDPRVKAVASITPYLTFNEDYAAAFGGRRITRAMASVTAAITGLAAVMSIELFWYAVPMNDLLAALPFTMDIARGMRDYYGRGRPGDRASWRNRLNFASNRPLLSYNPFDITGALRTPFYMAYGTRGTRPSNCNAFSTRRRRHSRTSSCACWTLSTSRCTGSRGSSSRSSRMWRPFSGGTSLLPRRVDAGLVHRRVYGRARLAETRPVRL